MSSRTLLRQVVDEAIEAGGHPPLDKLVRQMRMVDRQTWAVIVAEIYSLTNRLITQQTLISWYPQYRALPVDTEAKVS